MPDTVESLTNQRNLLAEALGKLLQHYGVTNPGAMLTGPDLLLAAHDALVHPAPNAVKPPVWADKPDEYTKRIIAAHPVNNGSHTTYMQAFDMVSHRHSKHELINLVNWLLQRQP